MKKKALSLLAVVILFGIVSVLAINLDIQSEPIANNYIIELGDPGVFDLTIKNNEEAGTFEIYSLVGINITHAPFELDEEETKKIRIYLTPQEALRKEQAYIFEYKIKDSQNEIQAESLTLNIVNINSAFSIKADPLNPKSERITLDIKNNLQRDFKNVEFKIISDFFEHEQSISFTPNEKKFVEVELDTEKLKESSAGNYPINTQIRVNDIIANIESQIKFLETEDIETIESKEGTIIQRNEVIKKNTGNIKKLVKITEEKSLIAYIFTTTNIAPTETESNGFLRTLTWEKVLIPNEELKVVTRTNWLFPIIIIIIILFGIGFIRKSIYDSLELTKNVSFIKTKGGQFALKVTVKARAKKKINNITIIDKLPGLVKLYNKFGILPPDKIDLENRKLHWNLPSLNKNETRVFTYIIYSDKIGIVGKFELPETRGVYEDEGILKETESNRSFYLRN